jgi:hypothetical protein
MTSKVTLDQPLPAADKAEDDLAAWLGDEHFEGEDRPATFNDSHVELYRCSWCGNPSAILRKCAGCSKTRYALRFIIIHPFLSHFRYCDASCQKSHWKEHKKACDKKGD